MTCDVPQAVAAEIELDRLLTSFDPDAAHDMAPQAVVDLTPNNIGPNSESHDHSWNMTKRPNNAEDTGVSLRIPALEVCPFGGIAPELMHHGCVPWLNALDLK